jgi:predicted outer membrane repeat protein
MRGFGLFVFCGGLAAASCLAAVAGPPADAAPGLAAYVGHLPQAGNPDGGGYIPPAARAVITSNPGHVIGTGTPASCTAAAVVKAVAAGGIITFSCGPRPVTITMTATAKVMNTSHEVVLDGGGKVTLNGAGTTRILYMNTCDAQQKITTSDCWEQQWPLLVVQNIRFENAYSAVRETRTSDYGGGAIFDQGGQLKVVNSTFTGDRCYGEGPDLGGGAIRALGMYMAAPVYITDDTFTGNSCANGAALSGLFANFYVTDSVMTGNKAVGWGANPASSGTQGGGSGGAIYTDGDHYNLTIDGTVISGNSAREGGGAIFFVVDAGGGTLRIEYSTLRRNPSGEFQNAPGIFDSVDGHVTAPVLIHSSIG